MMAAAGTARRAALGCTLVLASIVVLGAPGVASAQPARQDSVTVTGAGGFFTNIDIAVSSGPNGENPSGRVSFDVPALGVRVVDSPITCLNVSGSFAAIGVALPGGFVGIVLTVADNGAANSGFDTVDFVGFGSPAPSVCPQPFGGISPVTGGDVVVTDASQKPGFGCGDQNHAHTGSFACEQKQRFKGLKEDAVKGTGDFSGFDNVAIDVRSGPSGERPIGSVAFEFAGVPLESASITCLAVRGGAATIGGTAKPNAFGFSAAVVRVSDNQGLGFPDGFTAGPVAEAPTTCPPPAPFSVFGATGDIVVLDAGFKPGRAP